MKNRDAHKLKWKLLIGTALVLALGTGIAAPAQAQDDMSSTSAGDTGSDENPAGVPAYAVKHYQPPAPPPGSAAPANQPPPSMTPTSSMDQYIPGVPAYAIQRYGEPATPPPQYVPPETQPVGMNQPQGQYGQPQAQMPANTNIQPLVQQPSEMQAPAAAATAARPTPISQSSPVSVTGPVTPGHMPGFIEAGVGAQNVVHNGGNWFNEYITGAIKTDDLNVWHAEADNQHEFGQTGQYAAIGDTHTFNDDWYSDLTIGSGTNTIFLPRVRVDAFLNRKFLDDKSLVGTVGLGYYKEHGIHDDKSAFLGATYYFTQPWIVQGGIRINDSSPGSEFGTNQFIAVTQGRDKEHFITLRFGFGREVYDAIAANTGNCNSQNCVLVNLPTQEVSLTWRQWLGDDWGFNIRAEGMHNTIYHRYGLTTGVFKEF